MLNKVVRCPYCQSNLSKVIDKRAVSGRGEIRRRRECLKCEKRFTTYESLANLEVLVIKKDGRREAYSQEKLRNGILKSLEKRPDIDKASEVVDKIESKLREKGLREVATKVLGNWVLSELKKLDGVAYMRFASVYKTFQDPQDFEKALKSLH